LATCSSLKHLRLAGCFGPSVSHSKPAMQGFSVLNGSDVELTVLGMLHTISSSLPELVSLEIRVDGGSINRKIVSERLAHKILAPLKCLTSLSLHGLALDAEDFGAQGLGCPRLQTLTLSLNGERPDRIVSALQVCFSTCLLSMKPRTQIYALHINYRTAVAGLS
jgi:hypothetical protein